MRQQFFETTLFSFQGLTVRLENGKVTVARILIDSVIDRQGLVKTGDAILQVSESCIMIQDK